jgi:hypothetical protein
MLDHVGRQGLKITLYVRQSGVTELELVDQLTGRQFGHVGIQFAEALVQFPPP